VLSRYKFAVLVVDGKKMEMEINPDINLLGCCVGGRWRKMEINAERQSTNRLHAVFSTAILVDYPDAIVRAHVTPQEKRLQEVCWQRMVKLSGVQKKHPEHGLQLTARLGRSGN